MMGTKKMQLRLLGVVTTLAVIGVIVSLSVPVHVAEAKGDGGTISVDVLVDLSTFTGPGQPFHVQGPIYPAGTVAACTATVDSIGFYHCWGHVPLDGEPGVVSQEFKLFGRGKIQVQGQEGPGADIAVVGGTGDFRNVRGERLWVAENFCLDLVPPLLTLTVEFDLIGAGSN